MADAIAAELAAAALAKRRAGQTPTGRELAALNRFEKHRAEQQRWQAYATIPKKHWCEMSGRQAKVLLEQAATHGIPLAGRTVDLPAVVRWLHDFLAENKYKLRSNGQNTPQDEYHQFRMRRERFAFECQIGQWMRRADVHEGFGVLAAILRRAAENLQRQFGAEAYAIVDEALLDATRELRGRFGGEDEGKRGRRQEARGKRQKGSELGSRNSELGSRKSELGSRKSEL